MNSGGKEDTAAQSKQSTGRVEPYDPREEPIEPGRPRFENVVFVLVGVIGTIAAFLRGLGFV